MQQQQQNGKSTAAAAAVAAPSPTIGADKAAIYGHINVAGGAEDDEGENAGGGSRVSRGDRNKFCGSLPNHLDVGPDGEMTTVDGK